MPWGMRRVLLAALNVLAGAPAKAPGACALGALGVGDLRFALRGGSEPQGFGARATIAQALAAACRRPVDPAFRRAVAPPLQAVPLPPPRKPCPPPCPAAPGPVARIVCPLPTAACPERA